MHPPTLLLTLSAAAVAHAAAQPPLVTSALIAFGSDNDVYGSVVAVGSGLTTVSLSCPEPATSTGAGSGFDDACGADFKATLFLGGSTVSGRYTFTEVVSEMDAAVTREVNLGCALGTKDATCTGTVTQHGTLVAGTVTSTVSAETPHSEVVTDWTTEAVPLTITGGLEKLSGDATGTGAGAANTSTSKAGAPMVTARAVLAGVAAVVAAL